MALVREIIQYLTQHKDALLALGALAAIASPFVALRIANKNLKGTLITNQRRDWINEVRNEVAAILAGLPPLQGDSDATRGILLMNKLELTRAKLTLLMDPKNIAHRELMDAVNKAILHAHQARERRIEAREAKEPEAARVNELEQLDSILLADVDKLIDTTQKILAEAWEMARSLK